MRRVGHGTHMTRMRNSCNLFGKPEEVRVGLYCLREPVVLTWILKEWGVRMWIGFIRFRTGTNGGLI
jgi:hypothetical protein